MGFSLLFMRLEGNSTADVDRSGLASFLAQNGLHIAPSSDGVHHLSGESGALTFDGHFTDLHLDPLDKVGKVGGGIWHASLSAAECRFVYELCVAARMLIVNIQGAPTYLVPGRNHRAEQLPEIIDQQNEVVWVDSPEEFALVLQEGMARFQEFKRRAIDGSSETR